MHEIDHNLGLHHSGYGSEEYGDPSGSFGFSQVRDGTYPRMCYNAANNYQLEWYSQYSYDPTQFDEEVATFVISGVAGYDPNDTSKCISLKS